MLSLSLGPFALPVGPVLLLVASVLASLVAEWVARNRAKHAAVDGPDGVRNDAEPIPGRHRSYCPHVIRQRAGAGN